jgi:hypothetical protein
LASCAPGEVIEPPTKDTPTGSNLPCGGSDFEA